MTATADLVEEPLADTQRAPPSRPASIVKSAIEVAMALAGSSALLSALMLYFGWVRTRVLFGKFGVPVELLNFSTSDYLLRSADVFFKPAVWFSLGLAALGAVAWIAVFMEHVSNRRATLAFRAILAIATMICAVAGILGLVGMVEPEWAAVLLTISGALILMQYRLYGGITELRMPITALIVGLLLTIAATFWWVSIYAATIGADLARDIGSGALPRPAVAVYSKADLGLPGGMVPSSSADQLVWPYKYTGYKLLAYTNDRWFLIDEHWQPGSPAIILADDDSVRVELWTGPQTTS